MQNQKIIEYVEKVMAKTAIPDEYKPEVENELIKRIMVASDNTDTDVTEIMCSPVKLAEELTKKFADRTPAGYGGRAPDYGCPYPPYPPHRRSQGEFMHENSNVSLKLLYIPLLQISSGTNKMTLPLD